LFTYTPYTTAAVRLCSRILNVVRHETVKREVHRLCSMDVVFIVEVDDEADRLVASTLPVQHHCYQSTHQN